MEKGSTSNGNRTQIHLRDPELQETYTLTVSNNDANKAEHDLVFASALLNYARQHKNQNAVIVLTPDESSSTSVTDVEEDTTATLHMEESVDDTESTEPSSLRWSHEAILLLMEEYRKQEKDMYSGKISHKKAWELIAKVMNSKGYAFTAKQCTTRVNTMKRTYKATKDHNKKSGNNKRLWKYFELMESLLGEKPYMEPPATISSTGAETLGKVKSASLTSAIDSFCSNNDCSIKDKEALNFPVSRKRKFKDAETSTVMEIRKIYEEQQNRHKEKMEAVNKLMDKLNTIIEKIT